MKVKLKYPDKAKITIKVSSEEKTELKDILVIAKNSSLFSRQGNVLAASLLAGIEAGET